MTHLVVSSSETNFLKACISVTGNKYAKNTSTCIGPNKFNVQYHHSPELPIKPTVFAAFGGRKIW